MKTIAELTDDDIEGCVNGSSDIKMIRSILLIPGIIDEEGFIRCNKFAEAFALKIEGFIGEDEESVQWQEVWDNNFCWGFDIAEDLNYVLAD